MVTTLRIPLDGVTHERWEKIKKKAEKDSQEKITWEDVLQRGVESVEEWPDDKDWNRAILIRIDEKAGLT